MTKKDYELVAKALNRIYIDINNNSINVSEKTIKIINWKSIQRELKLSFALDNPKFDVCKFNNMCLNFYKK